jgi:hypothetical protein
MFGNYFYHQRIRKAVATFGAMFNDIYVLRKDASGGIINTQKVPLSYGPRSKFLDRIREVPDLEERRVAIKLPRMSFEIMNISYDPARQLPKANVTARAPVAGTVLSRSKIEVGVPYMISFQLSVFAKMQDDALQVVEQVIPYFNPQYTLSIKPFDDIDTIKEDVPIILTGVTMNDDYEGEVASRRTIVYTMDFDMHITFHGPVTSSGIIRTAITDILDINAGLNDSDVPLERITVTPNPGSASPDSDFGFTTNILGIDSAL